MNITVYCGSHSGTNGKYLQAAHDLGAWIGQNSHTLVYGGSSVGLMGAIARAVLDNGGNAIGVEPRFFIDAGVAQQNLTELHVVQTMAERRTKMIELGQAFVAMPGGVGTLEEITEIMSRIRLNLTAAPCFFLNIDGLYQPMVELLDGMAANGFLPGYERTEFLFPSTVDELTSGLAAFNPRNDRHSCEADWHEPAWMEGQIG